MSHNQEMEEAATTMTTDEEEATTAMTFGSMGRGGVSRRWRGVHRGEWQPRDGIKWPSPMSRSGRESV